jgi:nucleoside diphosphate kinase
MHVDQWTHILSFLDIHYYYSDLYCTVVRVGSSRTVITFVITGSTLMHTVNAMIDLINPNQARPNTLSWPSTHLVLFSSHLP